MADDKKIIFSMVGVSKLFHRKQFSSTIEKMFLSSALYYIFIIRL